jgi:hypothetical protein
LAGVKLFGSHSAIQSGDVQKFNDSVFFRIVRGSVGQNWMMAECISLIEYNSFCDALRMARHRPVHT